MILKDLMEEKQLNLNQPLLSVRRFASMMASERKKTDNSLATLPPPPSYKSELKSGPVRTAGTVPFVWEKAPGRPKDQNKSHAQAVEHPPITPNPPPGKVSKVKKQDFDAVSKGTSVTDMRCGSNVSNSQSIIAYLDREEIKEKASSDSDDGDETFVDALDTLSRTESFFMSSSVNGMSGLDDQEVQPSGSVSSSDQQARNFIIDRFLPAANAMISETHQYASSRKPLVGQEQQKQAKKVVRAETSLPLNQHRPKTLPHYAQDKTGDCNGAGNYTATGCRLFPRLCLLNPMPGLRMEDKAQGSAVHGMQAKSIAPHSETTKEHARTPCGKKSIHSKSGFTEEKDILCVYEKSKHGTAPHGRGRSKSLTCESTQHESSHESPIVEKTLYVDSVHKVKSHSSSCSSEMKCQTSHKGDSFETLRGGSGIYENPSNESSLGNSKRLEVVHEKATLHPMSLESIDSPFLICSGNSSNDMNMEMTNHSKKTDSEKQGMTKPINQGSDMDKDLVSSPKVIDLKDKGATKSVDQEYGSTQDPCTLVSSKMGDDGKIDLESQCFMKLGHKETPDASYLQLPLALPSLKAPSESWLKRTLPTISTSNVYSRQNLAANIHARSQTHKTASSLYPKWETIVKSSSVHHGYQRLPKELLSTIPEA